MSRLLLYLASASPRRLELLRSLGIEPIVRPARLDETPLPAELPAPMALRLAEAKARAVAERLETSDPPGIVLGADTAVVIDDVVLGKPADDDEAAAMLRRLCGRDHEVLTAVYLLRSDDGRHSGGVDTTRVSFRDYDEETIRNYVAGGEPLDKAGAYGIQGGGSRLARGLEGSWSNVVGLPLERLADWLAQLDIDTADLRG